MYQPIDINRVIEEYHITATAARLLSIINSCVWASRITGKKDRRGIPFCYASKETLARRLDKSLRTVARAIAELKAHGLITCQRTTRNAHIYITYYGTSETAKNGTSNNGLSINNNNQLQSSINLPCGIDGLPEQAAQTAASGPDLRREGQQPGMISEAATAARNGGQGGQQRPRSEATEAPRAAQAAASGPDLRREGQQPGMISEAATAARTAARHELEQQLERQLDLLSFAWTMPEYEREGEQRNGLARLILDAATAERPIYVNGCGLTGAQFWNEARHITPRTAGEILERVQRAEMRGNIANLRAYTLAAVYNGCQLDRVMRA